MSELVFKSQAQLRVGEVRQGLYDMQARFFAEQPYLVVSEATREKWIESALAAGYERPFAEVAALHANFFYVVHTD